MGARGALRTREMPVLVSILKSKFHNACVTEKRIDYEGSLSVDERLMQSVGFLPYERVLVSNITTGARFETYVIAAPAESGTIGLNGAAARLGDVGDRLIVMAFAEITPEEKITPRVAVLDERNRIARLLP